MENISIENIFISIAIILLLIGLVYLIFKFIKHLIKKQFSKALVKLLIIILVTITTLITALYAISKDIDKASYETHVKSDDNKYIYVMYYENFLDPIHYLHRLDASIQVSKIKHFEVRSGRIVTKKLSKYHPKFFGILGSYNDEPKLKILNNHYLVVIDSELYVGLFDILNLKEIDLIDDSKDYLNDKILNTKKVDKKIRKYLKNHVK